ncbi:MAG: hypothetical protein ACFCBW_19730 [Candidatus Competibacterales bacterium]
MMSSAKPSPWTRRLRRPMLTAGLVAGLGLAAPVQGEPSDHPGFECQEPFRRFERFERFERLGGLERFGDFDDGQRRGAYDGDAQRFFRRRSAEERALRFFQERRRRALSRPQRGARTRRLR